jgi:FlgD Ig-like domain/Cohesin domain
MRRCSRLLMALALFSGTMIFTLHEARAAVSVALVPSTTTVSPGTTFELSIRVTQAGSSFNAYQAIVHYDPTAVTFIPASPLSLQEGSYMTQACGETFHWFTSGTTEVGMVHSILCAGMSLTGPGELYVMHFEATGTPQTTPITFSMVEFANAGDTVSPVNMINTSIIISPSSDTEGAPPSRTALRIAPNPFNPSTVIQVGSEHAGRQSLEVYSPSGHLVRVLQDGYFPAGSRQVMWDGRQDDGTRLASGVYIVRLRSGETSHSARVVLLK